MVLIETKAKAISVRLNLNSGTELGNIFHGKWLLAATSLVENVVPYSAVPVNSSCS